MSEMQRTAILSDDQVYRYYLARQWDAQGTKVCFIMLNPSTADALKDDPTIRKCIGFAHRWGHGGLVVVNLFGFRATNPSVLNSMGAEIARGPENHIHFQNGIADATQIVAAYGVNQYLIPRYIDIIHNSGKGLMAFDPLTKHGFPRHPLYVSYDKPLKEFAI